MKSCVRPCVALCVLALFCSGCGPGATASPIRDTDGGRYPLGEIHFVEAGQRARGVFVAATESGGGGSSVDVTETTMLVPVGKTSLAGPAWATTEATVHGQRAHAIATLPDYRSAYNLTRYGDSACSRFAQHFVWVLGTRPLVLGLPSAEPEANWRQITTPANPWPTHFATDEALNQSVAGLVVYPETFWDVGEEVRRAGMLVSLVTLARPMSVNAALDALTPADTFRLGSARTVPLEAQGPSGAGPSSASQLDNGRPRAR
jgi:hypothetical protein